MFYNKVLICGVNTAKLPVMKEKLKIELIKKLRNGDKTAREELINGNLKLVLSAIGRFSFSKENADDLFQVGCIGLIKAIDNFDLSYDVRFSTYAMPMILGEIRRFLRDSSSVRVSRSLKDIAYKAMQMKEQLERANNQEPTNTEIAAALELPLKTVTNALESIVEPISLFETIGNSDGDGLMVMDQIGDGVTEDNWISQIMFKETIGNLTQREKKIMQLRFLGGKTQIEVSKEIGISQAQVSRLEKNVIDRVKDFFI